MEIIVIKKTGVPRAEIEAHQQIQREFSSTKFSNGWRGYAAFALARRGSGAGDDDFDLVLVTHGVIIAVELKNWHGKTLESDGQNWFVNGQSRPSPVNSIRLKVKKLKDQITQKLGRELTPFIVSIVVMHGHIETMNLTDGEKKSVLTMTEFLSLRFEHCYKNYAWNPRFNPLDQLKKYDSFFQGPTFRPKDYFVDGFRPEPNPILEHPKKLYSEFKATAKDDRTKFALIRQWNFSALGTALIGENDRSFIGLREQRIYDYVDEHNEDLSKSLLRPVTRKEPSDVTLDFAEVFYLRKFTRLEEFVHSTLPNLSSDERLTLVKAMLSRFADLHDLRIAHRDIEERRLWIERPASVAISGFTAAYYPEMKTVSAFRERIKVEQSLLPEDIVADKNATPYNRDVFRLGVIAYRLLFAEKPPQVSGVYKWAWRADNPFKEAVNGFLEKALNDDAQLRFKNAREMLEALNTATANQQPRIIDIAVFDAFKAATRENNYKKTEIFIDNEEQYFFRSEDDHGSQFVKIWFGVNPDPRKPDLSISLLTFLERARILKGCGIPGLPKIVDFGLSRGSLLLVLDWVNGLTLPNWLVADPSLDQRMNVAKSLTNTLKRLHDLELPHGDIHPQNIIVNNDNSAVLIDVLDFRLNADDFYTTAYLPDNYKSLSPFERDRFSLGAVLSEVFGPACDQPAQGQYPIPRVYEALINLRLTQNLSTLDPLAKALLKASSSEEENVPQFTIFVENLSYYGIDSGEFRSDNGKFGVSIERDRRTLGAIRVWITGIGRQLVLVWNLAEEKAASVKPEPISQSELLRTQILRDVAIRMRLELADGHTNDVQELVEFLLQNEKIEQKVQRVMGQSLTNASRQTEIPDEETITAEREPTISIPELWQTLLNAEEDTLLTVTIAGEKRNAPHLNNLVLVPYHLDSGEIDYSNSDIVVVENQTPDGTWRDCGNLNLRETTFGEIAELAIQGPNPRANFSIGNRLRFRTTGDKSSFNIRQFALDRILEYKAVIPNLIDYFEHAKADSLAPTTYKIPTDEELEVYEEGEKKLNPSQKNAFQGILGNGPICLLQGPPGTGKTWFIACFLHYLMTKERVRRILLVSQSNEAVNNALEKALEFCRTKGIEFNAVRLGTESSVSDTIRHLHTSSIEQSYKERFKAERKERIAKLAKILGLDPKFASEVVDLYRRLGTLSEQISKLQEHTQTDNENSIQSLNPRIHTLSETFFDIARDVYNFADRSLPPAQAMAVIQQQLIEQYGVRSDDAIERLHKILRLSEEWLGALGSTNANFTEFLAKSRTVVAGTLVGIGKRGTGVVDNIFDWVIVDEAGRATSSELAVAMQVGHRILLVGDHFQLPPTFSKEVKDAIKQRFSVGDESPLFSSDFERIFNSGYGRKVGTTLLRQYRMAPNIGELVSDCFYQGKLETGRENPPEYYDFLPEQFSKQVCWIDTSSLADKKGFEQTSENNEDKWNEAEARVVMELLRQILECEDFMEFIKEDLQPKEPPIGIICMYSKQRELIDRRKAEATWLSEIQDLVKVDTVDSYQGKENRIVIVSTVRNNPMLHPGFLRSPNRINVAISRAMERLFIIGASRMWVGRNSSLPLGKVFNKINSMVAEDRASLLPASQFLEK